MIKKIVESFGYSIDLASSALEGLNKLRQANNSGTLFDLIILDWMMPEMDGVEAARCIRNDLHLSVPIIMMNAFGKEIDQRASQAVHIDHYLVKPVDPSLLFNAIIDIFGQKAYPERHERGTPHRAPVAWDILNERRVLVVEDNLTNQKIAKAVLETVGIRVGIAENGVKGVAAVRANHYDAVLMDMQMPEMEGYEATRILRKEPTYKDLPIIAMTAHALKGDEEKCLAAGMDAYIAKPINRKVLFNVLAKTIQAKSSGEAVTDTSLGS